MIEVNLIAIIAATVVTMAIATIWYSPSVFGKQWMKDAGITEDDIAAQKKGMWKRFLAAFVAQFIVLYILAHLLVIADAFDGSTTAIGASIWVTILVAATSMGAVIWEKKSLRYLFINVGYTAVTLIGGGTIIFYWPW